MAVVWPSPLVTPIETPGTWPRICCGCIGPVSLMSFSLTTPIDAGVSASGPFSRVPVMVTTDTLDAGVATLGPLDCAKALEQRPMNAAVTGTGGQGNRFMKSERHHRVSARCAQTRTRDTEGDL